MDLQNLIDFDALDAAMLAPARIAPNGRYFQLASDGIEATVIAVETVIGRAIDFVAWAPYTPSRWWLATGDGRMLGTDAILSSAWLGRPLRWCETPAKWWNSRFWGATDTACALLVPAHG